MFWLKIFVRRCGVFPELRRGTNMRIIALPKMDWPAAKKMTQDPLTRDMLLGVVRRARGRNVRVLVCQDGRAGATPLTVDHHYCQAFIRLFTEYLVCDDYRGLDFGDLSFLRPAHDDREVVQEADILLFGGWDTNDDHCQRVLDALQSPIGQLVVDEVHYDRLLYIGVCGGATCIGEFPRAPLRGPGFDLLLGADICYYTDFKPEEQRNPYNADVFNNPIPCNTLVFTNFSRVSVWLTKSGAEVSSFVCTRCGAFYGAKKDWVDFSKVFFMMTVHRRAVTLHHYQWDGRLWSFRLDGWMCVDGRVCAYK